MSTTNGLDASHAVQNYDGAYVIPAGEAHPIKGVTLYKVTYVVDGVTYTAIEQTYYEDACKFKHKFRNYTPKVIPL